MLSGCRDNPTDPAGSGKKIGDMKLKIDDNLKKVAAAVATECDLSIISHLLGEKLVSSEIIADVPENYGLTIMEAAAKVQAYKVVFTLAEYLGTPSMSMEVFDAFCACVVMGDGDCPECGGNLHFFGTDGHEGRDGDYEHPNSWIVDKYVYKCPVCGEEVKSDTEL